MVSDGEIDSGVGGSSVKESKGIAELEKTSTSAVFEGVFEEVFEEPFEEASRTIWFVRWLNRG